MYDNNVALIVLGSRASGRQFPRRKIRSDAQERVLHLRFRLGHMQGPTAFKQNLSVLPWTLCSNQISFRRCWQ